MDGGYLAGIDIGTTGAKASIYKRKGQVQASGYREYPCTYPKPNWVEQDVERIISAAMDASRVAIAEAGIDPKQIASVAFSSQRCCTICVDDSGRLVRPMISWQDNRSVAEIKEISEKISDSDYFHITGFPNSTTWMLSKMLWIRNNQPKVWEKTAKVLQLQDFVLRAMGADQYFVDISDARFYGLWDPYNYCWSETLLELFDIDRSLLPQPTASGTRIGAVSEEAAERSGFAAGTPLCVGAGDQNSAAVGAGVISPGFLSVSLGTAGASVAFVDDVFRDPYEKTFVTNHAIYGKWQLEGYQAAAASVYRWFRDEIATLEQARARESGNDAYDIIEEMVSRIPAGSKGLLLLPYFASAATPRYNANARGTLVGITFAHDRACMARAFMEGITLDMWDMISSMIKVGIPIDKVRILGGPTRSETWNQIQADIYNRPVQTLAIPDAAVLGAAIMAGVGVGAFKDIAEGVEGMVSVDRTYEPIPENAKIYSELYDVYCRLYEGLDEKHVFESLAKMQASS